MTIFDIDQQIDELLCGSIDEETGELIFNEAALDALQMERDRKVEACALAYKNHLAAAAAIKAEIDAMKVRMEREQKTAERAAAFLDRVLAGTGFSTPKVEVKFTKSTTTEVQDEFVAWAEEHWKELLTYKPAPAPTPNRKAIAAAIKEGKEVPFASREEHVNIKIS